MRLVYAVAIADPASGPDAPTYDIAGRVFAHHGFFAGAPGIPYWPAGYPGFVSLFYWAFGDGSRSFAIAQVLLLAAATWSAYRIARRILGPRVATVTIIGLCISPALTASVPLLMYETPILAGLTIGADLILSAQHASGRRRMVLIAFGGLVVGIFATMQATIVLPALVMLVISCYALREERSVRVVLAAVCLGAMLLGPAVLVARNIHRGDGVGFAGNLGITMLVGAGSAGREIPCAMTDHSVAGDRRLTNCAIEHKLTHPLETVRVAADIEWKLWAPMVGPARKYGSWFHGFDYRRLVPDSMEYTTAFQRFDRWSSKAWEIGTIALIVAGIVLAFRRERDRLDIVWLAVPVLTWALMHSVIAGDARFRLPVSPFYVPFMAYAGLAVYDRVRSRLDRRIVSGGTADRGVPIP